MSSVTASINDYATVILLISEESHKVYVKLLVAKSPIFPLMKVTKPRFDALACTLGLCLAKYVASALFMTKFLIQYWTDNTVAVCCFQ